VGLSIGSSCRESHGVTTCKGTYGSHGVCIAVYSAVCRFGFSSFFFILFSGIYWVLVTGCNFSLRDRRA
jgi:hypothetical protein